MPDTGFLWKRLSADQRVITGPLELGGVIVIGPPNNAGSVTLYDGVDAGGRRFAPFYAGPARTEIYLLPGPPRFDQGLFADLSAGIDECVVIYRPVGARPGRSR